MNETINAYIARLAADGNLRRIPDDTAGSGLVDFSSNDYLGIAEDISLQHDFLDSVVNSKRWLLGASASRLLASRQDEFAFLEFVIEQAYGNGRRALLLNSGYHANTGLIPAIAGSGTVILADRLVHASIIDGIRLSGTLFERFRHNDMSRLEQMLAKARHDNLRPLVIVESVYSMDGDSPDFDALVRLKSLYPEALLYIDEAHAVGVCGDGLGLAHRYGDTFDVIVGTFGKALASMGAYAVTSANMREYLVNTSRSLIFSTALPPLTAMWNAFIFHHMLSMGSRRAALHTLASQLAAGLHSIAGSGHTTAGAASHIQCLIVGDPHKAVELSHKLRNAGLLVLPIRRPTVPPGTDRLRISLSAARSSSDIDLLLNSLR